MDPPTPPSSPPPPSSVGRNVLWLTIPRPEDVIVIYFLFALVTYILFMIVGLGHVIAVIMALLNIGVNWIVLLSLGALSSWISRSRGRERPVRSSV